MRPGCGKPTWNGQPNQFCGKTCKAIGKGDTNCAAGCGKPSWNGMPGEFCSKACRDNGASNDAGVPICIRRYCGKPTWNGEPNEYCSRSCRNQEPHPTTCKLLSPGDEQYEDVKKQYDAKWDTARGSPTQIRAIYEVSPSATLASDFDSTIRTIGNVQIFGQGTNPGNVQRRFHGTRLKCSFNGICCDDTDCSACRIMSDGFDISKLGKWSGNKGHYGGGLYFTSMASTAKGYGMRHGYSWKQGNWADPHAGNAILVVRVACGRVEPVKGQTDDKLDLSTYDSRKIDKDTGVDELVVFNPKQCITGYLICF